MLLSFIMPAYKRMYLEQAIKSIIMQTDGNWELVVVDDCSPEDLLGVVSSFNDPRIRYYRNETNIGGKDLVAQWNHSLSFATGEWIVMAADDDIYAPDFCSNILELSERHTDIDLIRSRVELIDEYGNHIRNDEPLPEFQDRYEFLNDYLTGRTLTCVGNYAFRLDALKAMGGFINFPSAFCSDIATPIQMAICGVANTSGLSFKFRESSVHLSGDKSRLSDKLEAFNQFYRWLDAFEYEKPSSREDEALYSKKNHRYIHAKYIYDCFNHVVKYVSLIDLPHYLGLCRDARFSEKIIMSARWLKTKAKLQLS